MFSFSGFLLTDRPTHVHEREGEGDGKRNIFQGCPSYSNKNLKHEKDGYRVTEGGLEPKAIVLGKF